MAAHVRWRRHRLRGRRGARSTLRLVAALTAPLLALALAPVVMAQPAAALPALTVGAGLLPSVVPSICVGGVVLCGGGVATVPVSPPAPLPTVCVPGVGCTTDVVPTPTPTATPRPSATPTARPTATVTTPSPGGPTNTPVVVLAAPPGVGLVPLPNATVSDAAFSPDSFANLLSLSMRDGLGSARYHVWPWLLGIQLVLWTVIAIVAWSRQLSSASRPR